MMVYNYKQIKHMDEKGITFKDGTEILFAECRLNWAKAKGLNFNKSFCVAERNISAKIPYFTFFMDEIIQITFKKTMIPWKNQYKKKFMDMQKKLDSFGYSSYDCS